MAANQNPVVPAVPDLHIGTNVQGSEAIVGIPTYTEIVREHAGLREFDLLHTLGAINAEEFREKIMRYINVTIARSIADLGADINAPFALQLNVIREGIQSIGAAIDADRARNFNSLHRIHPTQHGLNFRKIVKYTPGHPRQHPPGGVMRLDQPHQPVVFVPPYPVRAPPPAGLMPQNFNEL